MEGGESVKRLSFAGTNLVVTASQFLRKVVRASSIFCPHEYIIIENIKGLWSTRWVSLLVETARGR